MLHFKNKFLKKIKIAGHYNNGSDLTKISQQSSFSKELRNIIKKIKPKKIIETGTYLGTGTTSIIANAIHENKLKDCSFYSIEVNPEYHKKAFENLKKNNLLPHVTLLNGLSVPRKILPSLEEIEQKCVKNISFKNIFVDHEEEMRTTNYYKETNFKNVPDDIISICLEYCSYVPDLILLDSAGHMGNVEFNYIIKKLKKNCIIALDDIYHIKHHQSFLQILADKRFEVIVSSKEKFGFCITRFSP